MNFCWHLLSINLRIRTNLLHRFDIASNMRSNRTSEHFFNFVGLCVSASTIFVHTMRLLTLHYFTILVIITLTLVMAYIYKQYDKQQLDSRHTPPTRQPDVRLSNSKRKIFRRNPLKKLSSIYNERTPPKSSQNTQPPRNPSLEFPFDTQRWFNRCHFLHQDDVEELNIPEKARLINKILRKISKKKRK